MMSFILCCCAKVDLKNDNRNFYLLSLHSSLLITFFIVVFLSFFEVCFSFIISKFNPIKSVVNLRPFLDS